MLESPKQMPQILVAINSTSITVMHMYNPTSPHHPFIRPPPKILPYALKNIPSPSLPPLTALACSTSPFFLLPHPPDSSSAAAAAHPRSTPPSVARAGPSQCLPHRPSWSSSAAFSLADSSPCGLAAAVSPTGNAHARRRGR